MNDFASYFCSNTGHSTGTLAFNTALSEQHTKVLKCSSSMKKTYKTKLSSVN